MAAKSVISNMDKVVATLERTMEQIDRGVLNTMAFVGEEIVRDARGLSADNSYSDQTGNLRSSIGYAVSASGNITMKSHFAPVEGGIEGTVAGNRFLQGAIDNSDYQLVAVAGMDYAKYVQAMPNHDVILGPSMRAEKSLRSKLQRLRTRQEQVLTKIIDNL